MKCVWNVKAEVILLITGATGTVSKSFRKYMRHLLGKHRIKELQITAIFGTANIFCLAATNVKVQYIHHGK